MAPGKESGLGYRTTRARVPLRLGLAGGGTDLSPYCDQFGGAVLNTTIDRYAYACVEPSLDGLVHFVAPDLDIEEVLEPTMSALKDVRLVLHAGVARHMIDRFGNGRLPPIHVTSYVDAPPGSGLGSSSALVVALVEAFAAQLDAPLGPYDVANVAFQIERVDLQLAGGRQDQYAATFGGTNFIEFHSGETVVVNPLRVAAGILNELEASLVICFSGVSRRSEEIIVEQQRGMVAVEGFAAGSSALDSLHQLKQDAVEMKQALLRGEVERMALILSRSWEAKKRTASGISTRRIEELYDVALAAGAIGGKVSGAGGGGFMMFLVPPNRRISVVRALNSSGGDACGVHLTHRGAESWTLD